MNLTLNQNHRLRYKRYLVNPHYLYPHGFTINFIFLCIFDSLQSAWPFCKMYKSKVSFTTGTRLGRWHNNFCNFPMSLKYFLQLFSSSVFWYVLHVKGLYLRLQQVPHKICQPQFLTNDIALLLYSKITRNATPIIVLLSSNLNRQTLKSQRFKYHFS